MSVFLEASEQLLVGVLPVRVYNVREDGHGLFVAADNRAWCSCLPAALILTTQLFCHVDRQRPPPRAELAGKPSGPRSTIDARDHSQQRGKVGVAVLVDLKGGRLVPKGHLRRRPTNFASTIVLDDTNGRGEQDESHAIRASLGEREPYSVQFTDASGIHQILAVTPRAAEAAELPERIGPHLVRIAAARLSKMETEGIGTVHMHNGSGGTYYAHMEIHPEQDFVVVVATNVGLEGQDIAQRIVEAVTSRYAH